VQNGNCQETNQSSIRIQDDTQLKEVKFLLAQYFSKKASVEMDKLLEENN